MYYLSSDIDNAKKDLETALKIIPDDVEVLRRLALTDDRIPELTILNSQQIIPYWQLEQTQDL